MLVLILPAGFGFSHLRFDLIPVVLSFYFVSVSLIEQFPHVLNFRLKLLCRVASAVVFLLRFKR